MDKYCTTKEVANLLGVKVRTIQDWCKNQKISGIVKMGKIYLINKQELDKWMKKQQVQMNKIWKFPKFFKK